MIQMSLPLEVFKLNKGFIVVLRGTWILEFEREFFCFYIWTLWSQGIVIQLLWAVLYWWVDEFCWWFVLLRKMPRVWFGRSFWIPMGRRVPAEVSAQSQSEPLDVIHDTAVASRSSYPCSWSRSVSQMNPPAVTSVAVELQIPMTSIAFEESKIY